MRRYKALKGCYPHHFSASLANGWHFDTNKALETISNMSNDSKKHKGFEDEEDADAPVIPPVDEEEIPDEEEDADPFSDDDDMM